MSAKTFGLWAKFYWKYFNSNRPLPLHGGTVQVATPTRDLMPNFPGPESLPIWVSEPVSFTWAGEVVSLNLSERPSLRHLSESLCLTHWPLVAHSPRVVAAASSPARLLRILASPPSALPTLPTLLALPTLPSLPTLPTTPLLVNSWDARNLHLSFVTCACKSSANQSSIDPGHDLDDKAPSASLGKLCSISSEGSLVSSNRSWYARNLQRSRHWNECAKETCT